MKQTKKTNYAELYPSAFTAEDYVAQDTYQYTRAPVESALTLIPQAYTSPEFYAIEQKRVFGDSWVAVCCTSQLQKPEDVHVADVAGQSIIITRNKSGELRAFFNVCRHRGTKILDNQCKQVKGGRIRCPYHGWAFDLNGNCVSTPMFENSNILSDQQAKIALNDNEKFDASDYGLFSVQVDTWGFLIFVNLNPDACPLSEYLGDLPTRFENYRLHEWVVVREKEFVINANYKLIAENFMECYHLPWVHPELVKVTRVEDHYSWQGPGMYTCLATSIVTEKPQSDELLRLPPIDSLNRENRESARYVWLFPNVGLFVLPNHVLVMLTKPDGTDRCIQQIWLVSHPQSINGDRAESELDELLEFWSMVNEQDIDIVEKVQEGISMKPFNGGPMCYHFEEFIHRYQNMVIDKMIGPENGA